MDPILSAIEVAVEVVGGVEVEVAAAILGIGGIIDDDTVIVEPVGKCGSAPATGATADAIPVLQCHRLRRRR